MISKLSQGRLTLIYFVVAAPTHEAKDAWLTGE